MFPKPSTPMATVETQMAWKKVNQCKASTTPERASATNVFRSETTGAFKNRPITNKVIAPKNERAQAIIIGPTETNFGNKPVALARTTATCIWSSATRCSVAEDRCTHTI